MEDSKGKSIGPKLYGGPSFETGTARAKKHAFQVPDKPSKPAGHMKSGPQSQDAGIGRKAKGTMTTGTKGDERGEDSGGKA